MARTHAETCALLLDRVTNGIAYLEACVARGDLATYRTHFPAWERLLGQLAAADDARRAEWGLPPFRDGGAASRRRDIPLIHTAVTR